MKLTLSGRAIPRNAAGDPAFVSLTPLSNDESDPQLSVLQVFTPAEVVELVNRCLYQLEYQQRAHAKRQREQTELMQPVKRAVRRLFKVSWSQATEEQVAEALVKLKEDPTLGEE